MARLPHVARRSLLIVAVLATLVVVVLGVSMFSLYEATQRVPAFYHQAISRPPAAQQAARDAFVAQAAALASDLDRSGPWQSLFTAEQINAWLALELARHYPGLLVDDLHDPRVVIDQRRATLACRYDDGEMAAVLSLAFDVYLHEPNVLAVRIRGARAGALPVPIAQVLDNINHAAVELGLRIEWHKSHGDPVALIDFAQQGSSFGRFCLSSVELRNGAVYLAGTAGNAVPAPAGPTVAGEHDASDQPLVGAAPKETLQK